MASYIVSSPSIRRMTQAELDSFLETAANILRGNVDHSEFRGYVFALLFFKRISDVYEENVRILERRGLPPALAREPRMHEFVVPEDCLWGTVARKEASKLGTALNDAMRAIERANAPKFDGILFNSSVDFNAQQTLPRGKLIELINHFSSKSFDRASVSDDVFGNAYEYLIRSFASKAGKSSGEFYTPREVAYLMAEIVEPQPGNHICDWAAGSGGLLLQCRRYVEKHYGPQMASRLFFYLQESNLATYNISRINMILHGVHGAIHRHGDSLRAPQFLEGRTKRLRQFDRIVMNPPFSLESWGHADFTDGDPYDRFKPVLPPRDNGDYAWLLQVVRSLKPTGRAIVVMSQGVLFRGQPEQTEEEDGRNQKADVEYLLRESFVKSDLIEAIIVLPQKIFYGNNVPGCLVVLNKSKAPDRKEKALMIWAARNFQADNPQNRLRRADVMRILVPWRAFGDLEKCRKLIPQHEQALIADLEQERETALRELHEAYDPAIETLRALETELAKLEAFDPKAWLEQPNSDDPYLGEFLPLVRAANDTALSKAERQAASRELRLRISLARKTNRERLKEVRQGVREYRKLEVECRQKEAGIHQRAERKIGLTHETAVDLLRICSDPDEVSRYFAVVHRTEIEENEFNLNLPRYIDTFETEEKIDLRTAIEDLEEATKESDIIRTTLIEKIAKLIAGESQ